MNVNTVLTLMDMREEGPVERNKYRFKNDDDVIVELQKSNVLRITLAKSSRMRTRHTKP